MTRTTRVSARLLRRASLDELPQLWNVLIGDTSAIPAVSTWGPRHHGGPPSGLGWLRVAPVVATHSGTTGRPPVRDDGWPQLQRHVAGVHRLIDDRGGWAVNVARSTCSRSCAPNVRTVSASSS